jgi:hypothetical protein
MKKYLLILFISLSSSFAVFAQDDDGATERGGQLLERMQQYIQKRLNMTKSEAERFSPVFLRYVSELRRTHREFRGDKPVLQLRVAEVRVRFRNEFRQVVDEQRANRVFQHQKEFEDIIRNEIKERKIQNRRGPGGRVRLVNPQ